ncbi:uncharacterized protein LOC132299284 isoform X1 [Cornus florida]|uniref:uncharacterized protein LOC132299284 isoform X1 n=1 Tax=Cornus florida TaxID=4283 RepID=UPI00289E3186|nr:uncharacterized protein LOC132299284 isoform X1 [Cornus florida]
MEKRKLELTPPAERNDGSSKRTRHNQSIISKQSGQDRCEYLTILNASIDSVRFVVKQGLAFRVISEFEDSSIQKDFLPFLRCLADYNENVKSVVLNNAPENLLELQKDITNVTATETVNLIIKDIGDAFFSILIGDSYDISMEEHIAVVLRYVNKDGNIIERFIGILHVRDITALSLKTLIDELFSRHGLSISRLRGQGYDGVTNMQCEFNSLKILILKENEFAFFVHCFDYELQLALVAMAKNQIGSSFITLVGNVMKVLETPCKHHDILREKQVAEVIETLDECEISCWGSNYGTLIRLIVMFSSVIGALAIIEEDGSYSSGKYEANNLLESMQTFSFVLNLHLMRIVLGITNELSKALQRRDQDIVNSMSLVKVSKQRLQMMREDGWDSFT